MFFSSIYLGFLLKFKKKEYLCTQFMTTEDPR